MEHALDDMHWRVYGSRGWGWGGTVRTRGRRPRPVSVTEIHFPSDWEEGSLTFMILSRSSKKRWGLSGFVKKSARFSSLRTKGTQILASSMASRMKKWRRSTCLSLPWF